MARFWCDAGHAHTLLARGKELGLDGDDLLIAERGMITRIPLLLVASMPRTAPAAFAVHTQDGTRIEIEAAHPELVDIFLAACLDRIEAQRRLPPGRPSQITITRDPPAWRPTSRRLSDWNWPLLAAIAAYLAVLAAVAVWLGPSVAMPMLYETPLLLAAVVAVTPVIRVVRASYTQPTRRHRARLAAPPGKAPPLDRRVAVGGETTRIQVLPA